MARAIFEELQRAPWVLTSDFVEGHAQQCHLLRLTGPGDPSGALNAGFSFVRSKDRAPKRSKTALASDKEKDLRSLTTEEAKIKLRELGMTDEKRLGGLKRWERTRLISELARDGRNASLASRYVRDQGRTQHEQREEYRLRCRTIWDNQAADLKAAAADVARPSGGASGASGGAGGGAPGGKGGGKAGKAAKAAGAGAGDSENSDDSDVSDDDDDELAAVARGPGSGGGLGGALGGSAADEQADLDSFRRTMEGASAAAGSSAAARPGGGAAEEAPVSPSVRRPKIAVRRVVRYVAEGRVQNVTKGGARLFPIVIAFFVFVFVVVSFFFSSSFFFVFIFFIFFFFIFILFIFLLFFFFSLFSIEPVASARLRAYSPRTLQHVPLDCCRGFT